MEKEKLSKNRRLPPTRPLDSQRLKYDALIEGIGEGLIVIDGSGKIERVNSYAVNALGFSEAELMGAWFPAAVVLVDEYGESVDPLSRPITRALTEGKAVSEYANLLRKDGTKLPVLLTASPIILADKPVGAIEIFRDLTRERELDIAKDEFVSIASHQLRTPAASIRGILSMLLAGDFGELNATQRRYAELAVLSNDRQLEIIEDLLSIAQADSGRMDLSLADVDLSQLIAQSLPEYEVFLSNHNQRLKSSLESGVTALMDREKIKMVVDNLISNAIKYTPENGTIEVSLYTSEGSAHICVRDNGVGIPAGKLDTIFAKFARVDNELSTPAGGTGLGLYLAKKIANLHRGDITVSSKVGEGSYFSFTLPLKKKG